MKPKRHATENRYAGLVGMGLMGTSIAACLLAAGYTLRAVDHRRAQHRRARARLKQFLNEMQRRRLSNFSPGDCLKRFSISDDYAILNDSDFVIEAISEDLAKKREAIGMIEAVVSARCLIASNTSAIPITTLQQGASHPQRILGLHWAEPAHITRFMEIICGSQTSVAARRLATAIAVQCGKEPSVLKKDIRGFITNRIFYAMLREAFYLVESGVCAIADVDRSMRNDLGWWITLAGPFRMMDLTGIPAYGAVMKDLWPDLSTATGVPSLMRKVVASGAKGVSNAKGFYQYTPAQARAWERKFIRFSHEIRALAMKYPDNGR